MNDLSLTGAEMVVQYGFAGFSIILLFILLWLLRKFIELQRRTIEALNENSQVAQRTKNEMQEVKELTVEIKDKLQARPCIARQE